jgi:hypothetical protein
LSKSSSQFLKFFPALTPFSISVLAIISRAQVALKFLGFLERSTLSIILKSTLLSHQRIFQIYSPYFC